MTSIALKPKPAMFDLQQRISHPYDTTCRQIDSQPCRKDGPEPRADPRTGTATCANSAKGTRSRAWSISQPYIRADQAAFLEHVQADRACTSKREALMLVLDRFKEIHEADNRNQEKED